MDIGELREQLSENLKQQQEELFRRLKEKIEEEIRSFAVENDEEWNITTVLAESSVFRPDGVFEPVSADIKPVLAKDITYRGDILENGIPAGIAFLNCPYSQINDWLGRRFHGSLVSDGCTLDMEYELRRFRGFEEREGVIARTALQYRIEKPYIYSPMSRRAVSVILFVQDTAVRERRDLQADLCLEKNGLEQILLCGKTLLWDVETKRKEALGMPAEYSVPGERTDYRKYHFATDKNQYIYLRTSETCLKRTEQKSGVDVYAAEPPELLDYERLTLKTAGDKLPAGALREYSFHNRIQNKGACFRIRTRADVESVVSLYCPKDHTGRGLNLTGITRDREAVRNGRYKEIKTYEKMDCYYRSVFESDNCLRGACRDTPCYLVFERQDDLFFEDRVSYLTEYMNLFYPEFYWVGVTKAGE